MPIDRRSRREGRAAFMVALAVVSLTTLLGALGSGCQPKEADTNTTASSEAYRKSFAADPSRMSKNFAIPGPPANLPSDIPADVRAKIQAAQPQLQTQPQTQPVH